MELSEIGLQGLKGRLET